MADVAWTSERLFATAVLVEGQRNSIHYHECCKSWTTKGSKKRSTHGKFLTWKELLDRLGIKKGEEDTEKFDRELKKLTGGSEVRINIKCPAKNRPSPLPVLPFRLHRSGQPPQGLQANFSTQNPAPDREDQPENLVQGMF